MIPEPEIAFRQAASPTVGAFREELQLTVLLQIDQEVHLEPQQSSTKGEQRHVLFRPWKFRKRRFKEFDPKRVT